MNRLKYLIIFPGLLFALNAFSASFSDCGPEQNLPRPEALERIRELGATNDSLSRRILVQSQVLNAILERFGSADVLPLDACSSPDSELLGIDNTFAKHDAISLAHNMLSKRLTVNSLIIKELFTIFGLAAVEHYEDSFSFSLTGKHWIGCYLDKLARAQEQLQAIVGQQKTLINIILAKMGPEQSPPLNINFNYVEYPEAELKALLELVARSSFSYNQTTLGLVFDRIGQLKYKLGIYQHEHGQKVARERQIQSEKMQRWLDEKAQEALAARQAKQQKSQRSYSLVRR